MADPTREKVLDAARGLFVMRGYRNTTVADIARSVGISKRTVYEHFSSKDEIAREVVETQLALFSEQMKSIIKSGDDPLTKLRNLSHFYMELPYPGISRTALIDLQRDLPQLWERVEQAKQEILSELEQVIDEGKEVGVFRPDISSDIVITALTGALQSAMSPEFLLHSSLSLEEVYDSLFELMTGGISRNSRGRKVKTSAG